ncbi:hypothetical protein [Luteitalea sp.]
MTWPDIDDADLSTVAGIVAPVTALAYSSGQARSWAEGGTCHPGTSNRNPCQEPACIARAVRYSGEWAYEAAHHARRLQTLVRERWHPNYRQSGVKGMHWHQPSDYELSEPGRGGVTRGRASVWSNATWHTWDRYGTGGENSREATVEDAMREAEAALIRQGWGKPAQEGGAR